MKINLGYRAKLLFAISTVSIIMLAILTFSRILLMEDILQERTLTRVETIGNILKSDIQQNLIDHDYDSMRKTVVVTAAQKHIQFVSVLDKDSSVIFSSEKNINNKTSPYKDSEDIKKEKSLYIKSFQMKVKDKILGYVQIAFVLETVKADIERVTNRTITVTGLALFLLIGVSWIISGGLLAPLYKMKAVSEKIARGDFSERLEIRSRDIIGGLASSLNNMAKQLGDLTTNLNKKVEEATSKLLEKTKELEESNIRLKELDKLKSEFVSIVSHELRTPLTGIIGFAKTLLKVKVSDEQREKYLTIIESEGKRLATLIDEFLDISRIESGNVELQLEIKDIRDLIKETISNFEQHDMNKIEFNLSLNPLSARVDGNKIKQVITNILNNALRYTDDGKRVTVSANDSSNAIMVSIKDDGPGISKENQTRIFEKFYRCKDEKTNKSRGSGLGLAIAKGIIDMHKGKIWAESEPGKGSNFKFSVPREENT